MLQNYLRPPKSATAADGVIGTAMKSCIQKHPTHLDQRPLRPPKGAFARFHGCSNDNIGGRSQLRRPELVLQKAQTSVIIGGVVDTGEQFIAGVVDTGQK